MRAATTIDVKHGFANNGSRYGVICKVICRVIFMVIFCKLCLLLRVIFRSNGVNKCTCHQPQNFVCSNIFDLIQLRARQFEQSFCTS